ncbi:hypothetical protein ML5_0882 [Micromonospora sp. L5]|uniref:hypothetical protein n=1 Tax=Micromonospora sp. (strain L5) TaxID=648999 RepID=UPI0001C45CA2|nr:hypothetical protein [Micromonospora sp. L5]ADU06424.1 hypothetical protein ML5_0882 [Micromonospora sp. L5]
MNLKAGDLLHVTRAASVQFGKPIIFRLIRVLPYPTYDRWAWLDGYQLNEKGDAVERREIFVQPEGLRKLAEAKPSPAPLAPRLAPRKAPAQTSPRRTRATPA